MSEVTNAQLMNAIKLLTRKVEELQEEVAGLKRGKSVSTKAVAERKMATIELGEFNKLPETVVKAVLGYSNLKDAAEALNIKESALKKVLEASGIPHLMYEPWARAVARSVEGTPVVDDYTYPDTVVENFEKILKYIPKEGIKELAAKIGVPIKVLSRYLWRQGYNTKAEFVGKPAFEIL